jgi:type VI secretion system protein ImpK
MTAATAPQGTRQGQLAQILQELLTVGVRLRATTRNASPNVDDFRAQLHKQISDAGRDGQQAGYSAEGVGYALYAVVAFLDESVLALPDPAFASWRGQPLQLQFFQVHVGGDVLFQYLTTLLGQQDSEELGDVLEVYQLCLLLGFKGKYGASRPEELHQWTARLRDRIAQIRGNAGPRGPAWEPPRDKVTRVGDPWQRRLGVIALGILGVTLLLFLVFLLVLRSRTGDIVSAIR